MSKLRGLALTICILGAIAVVAATPPLVALFRSAHWVDPQASLSLFADQFSIASTLFSALAFAALVFAVVLQMSQLRLQQTELANQREELDLMRQEMQKSSEALSQQVRVQRLAAIVSGMPIAIQERRARLTTLDLVQFPPQAFDGYSLDGLEEKLRMYGADLEQMRQELGELESMTLDEIPADPERASELKNNIWWTGARAEALGDLIRLMRHLDSAFNELTQAEGDHTAVFE